MEVGGKLGRLGIASEEKSGYLGQKRGRARSVFVVRDPAIHLHQGPLTEQRNYSSKCGCIQLNC